MVNTKKFRAREPFLILRRRPLQRCHRGIAVPMFLETMNATVAFSLCRLFSSAPPWHFTRTKLAQTKAPGHCGSEDSMPLWHCASGTATWATHAAIVPLSICQPKKAFAVAENSDATVALQMEQWPGVFRRWIKSKRFSVRAFLYLPSKNFNPEKRIANDFFVCYNWG